MSLTGLLASKRIQHQLATPSEIAGLRKLIARDLKDAAVPGLSADRVFATAYNAVLQLSKMALACGGYRVSANMPGHHQTTFEAARLVLGPPAQPLTDYFETCRRKRNVIDYDQSEVATESQAEELLEKAGEYQELVEAWIAKKHPKYKRNPKGVRYFSVATCPVVNARVNSFEKRSFYRRGPLGAFNKINTWPCGNW